MKNKMKRAIWIALAVLFCMACTIASAAADWPADAAIYVLEDLAKTYNQPAPKLTKTDKGYICADWLGCSLFLLKLPGAESEIVAAYITAKTANPADFMVAVYLTVASVTASSKYNPFLDYMMLLDGEPVVAWRIGESWLYRMSYDESGALSFVVIRGDI